MIDMAKKLNFGQSPANTYNLCFCRIHVYCFSFNPKPGSFSIKPVSEEIIEKTQVSTNKEDF